MATSIKRFLCFLCLLLSSHHVWAPPLPVKLRPEPPDYDTLQTVVRLNRTVGLDDSCLATAMALDTLTATGASLMVETRDSQGRYAWFATVFFKPQTKGITTLVTQCVPSDVLVKLFRAPGYGDEDRTYGDAHNTSTDRAHIPLKASSFTLEEPDPLFLSIDEKRCISQHQEALASSLFEWRLKAPLTISRFFYKLQDMRMDGHFPHYNLYGYDTRGGALNCVTFAMTLLKSLKGRESIPPHLLPDYQQPTALGHITGPMPLRSAGLGFLVGYCGSLLIMPPAWPLIALWAGVGAGAGAGVGLPLTYILNKQSEMRHMITLETVFNTYLKDKEWADIVTIKPEDGGGYAKAWYEQYKNPFVLRALNTLRGQEKNVGRKPLHYVFGNQYSFVDDQSTNT